MVFCPVLHLTVLGIIAVLDVPFMSPSAKRITHRRATDALRRFPIVVIVTIMGAGPSVPGEAQGITSTLEVYFVINCTSFMATEDWDSSKPRIDGVRNDISIVTNILTGSRFFIMSRDSRTHTGLPLTSDVPTVISYMDSPDRELSSSSQESSVSRPTQDLAKLLKKSKEHHPQNMRVLFVFSGGETSNQNHWTSASSGETSDWDVVKEYIDGGPALGYGTKEDGPIKILCLGDSDSQNGGEPEYIHDSSQLGSPIAISKTDEAALKDVVSHIGVDYVHLLDKSVIESYAYSVSDEVTTLAEPRDLRGTYRYII